MLDNPYHVLQSVPRHGGALDRRKVAWTLVGAVVGFVSAFLLLAVVHVWNHSGIVGGISAKSANGMYDLSVMAPLRPTHGGSYDITLVDLKTGSVLRRVVVTVPNTEVTVSVRGGEGTITWDPASAFVDFAIDGQDAIRVWAP